MIISDIKAVNWQLSVLGLGLISEGIDDIRQCVQLILTNTKGSDPMRPLFGSDIWQHVDKPVNIASALISAEIVDALDKWEPRIIIKKIIHNIDGSKIDFELTIELIESGETTQISFYIDRQTQIEGISVGRNFSNGFDFGFN